MSQEKLAMYKKAKSIESKGVCERCDGYHELYDYENQFICFRCVEIQIEKPFD